MGRFTDLVREQTAPRVEQLADSWQSQFPLLTEAFYPAPGKASGTFLSPKYSVTVFSEGLSLKAVVGSREAAKKLWITLDGPEAVLEQIELALKTGRGEWRDAKQQD